MDINNKDLDYLRALMLDANIMEMTADEQKAFWAKADEMDSWKAIPANERGEG